MFANVHGSNKQRDWFTLWSLNVKWGGNVSLEVWCGFITDAPEHLIFHIGNVRYREQIAPGESRFNVRKETSETSGVFLEITETSAGEYADGSLSPVQDVCSWLTFVNTRRVVT